MILIEQLQSDHNGKWGIADHAQRTRRAERSEWNISGQAQILHSVQDDKIALTSRSEESYDMPRERVTLPIGGIRTNPRAPVGGSSGSNYAKQSQFRCFGAENEGRAEKQSQSVRARRLRLRIWDWGFGIRSGEYAEWWSEKCQTNPISRVFGLKTRVEMKTKPICADVTAAIGDLGLGIGDSKKRTGGRPERKMSNKANFLRFRLKNAVRDENKANLPEPRLLPPRSRGQACCDSGNDRDRGGVDDSAQLAPNRGPDYAKQSQFAGFGSEPGARRLRYGLGRCRADEPSSSCAWHCHSKFGRFRGGCGKSVHIPRTFSRRGYTIWRTRISAHR